MNTSTTETRDSIVKEYLAGGTTYRKLQEKHGYDFRTIRSWVKNHLSTETEPAPSEYHEAPKLFKRWKGYEDAKLRSMVKNGYSSEAIALELGRTRSAISGRKSQLGIKERITPARGSKMPYTAFSRNRSEKPAAETASPVASVPAKELVTEPRIKSLGTTIDTLIHKAKSMGLKINITVSSQE
jgi:hypothetical protein